MVGMQAAGGAGVTGRQRSRPESGQTDSSADRSSVHVRVGLITAGCVGSKKSDATAARMGQEPDTLRDGRSLVEVKKGSPGDQMAEAVGELTQASGRGRGLVQIRKKVVYY